jgi:uncharacterized protein (DUF924 family)
MTGGTNEIDPQDVLAFWRGAGPEKWFKKDAAFDAEVGARFLGAYERAVRGELSGWEATPEGALALVIVLDQFPRNMFRAQARTYAADALARDIARRALARGFDRDVSSADRQFFYLPFMHSEDLADQEHCVALARDYGNDEFTEYAEQHADIVRRFGRFPHRNAMLGRATTPAEQEFLDGGGFAG